MLARQACPAFSGGAPLWQERRGRRGAWPCADASPRLPAAQRGGLRALPFDTAWAPNVSTESLAPGLFAFSIVPYAGFLYHLTRSKQAPPVMLFGFYFLLVFVGVTIPAGIYAKSNFGTSLANVDWLHGGAESLLTITNLLIVWGLRQGIRDAEAKKIEQVSELVVEPESKADR